MGLELTGDRSPRISVLENESSWEVWSGEQRGRDNRPETVIDLWGAK